MGETNVNLFLDMNNFQLLLLRVIQPVKIYNHPLSMVYNSHVAKRYLYSYRENISGALQTARRCRGDLQLVQRGVLCSPGIGKLMTSNFRPGQRFSAAYWCSQNTLTAFPSRRAAGTITFIAESKCEALLETYKQFDSSLLWSLTSLSPSETPVGTYRTVTWNTNCRRPVSNTLRLQTVFWAPFRLPSEP